MAFKTILVATDFSPCAQAALDVAADLAVSQHARVTLLHVYPLPTYVMPEGTVVTLDSGSIRQIERSIDEQLTKERQRVARTGLEIALESMESGAIAHTIVERAKALHCDLIVTGTHGRGGFKRLLLGSVAERILRIAPCPVTVVRERDQ